MVLESSSRVLPKLKHGSTRVITEVALGQRPELCKLGAVRFQKAEVARRLHAPSGRYAGTRPGMQPQEDEK